MNVVVTVAIDGRSFALRLDADPGGVMDAVLDAAEEAANNVLAALIVARREEEERTDVG